MELPEAFMQVLACPRCQGPLTRGSEGEARDGLRCPVCRRTYPIQEGVPQLLEQEARPDRDV